MSNLDLKPFVLAAFSLFSLPILLGEEPIETVAQEAKRIDAQLDELQKTPPNDSPDDLAKFLFPELEALKERSIMIFGRTKAAMEGGDSQVSRKHRQVGRSRRRRRRET